MEVNFQPPLKQTLNEVDFMMKKMPPTAKHWFLGGSRVLAIGVKLLREEKIIASPTDTIYGLAALAQNERTIKKLYDLKGRDADKPLAICVSSVKDIPKWAETDHLPRDLLPSLLPGPVTVVLKRKPGLNPSLNPGVDTIGIRVPVTKFLRSLCKLLDQPLALTSANSSGQQSSLKPDEFRHLWDQLGGIFYTLVDKRTLDDSWRVGSTIVDLSVPGHFKILRYGIKHKHAEYLLYKHKLVKVKEPDECEMQN